MVDAAVGPLDRLRDEDIVSFVAFLDLFILFLRRVDTDHGLKRQDFVALLCDLYERGLVFLIS